MFHVCVLFYGDHLDLAERCLGSLTQAADWPLITDLRLALAAAGDRTRAYVEEVARRVPVPCHLYEPIEQANPGKYPLMRRMLYDPGYPTTAQRVMWWDDDSYLRSPSDVCWWRKVAEHARQVDLLGSTYRISMRGRQHLAVPHQPWYTGKPVAERHRMFFATGGWWIASRDVLVRWNWPVPELHHNGGDAMLGELIRQQGLRLDHYREGVAINADTYGTESAAERRGLQTKWLWEEWDPARPPDLDHQRFTTQVTTYMGGGAARLRTIAADQVVGGL